ncbi:unnamed protein product [Caenorhabditis angaria]|uniref:TatD related DNase n=1 Tax=Caenorhabditis angaria TaxID=860376 RepID=A0A9P1MZ31_9PELO|nr:unnamed protein product [Caenorhabditis angaria]
MIDVHCHLADNKFKDDIDDVIKRAIDSGVTKMIAVAEFGSQFENVLNLSKKYEKVVYAGIGVHPIQKRNKCVQRKHLAEVETFLSRYQQKNVICVGEIGLDHTFQQFKLSEQDLHVQEEVFIAQIRLAKQFNLPMNIHSRSAARRTLEVLKSEQINSNSVVLHAFDGNIEDVSFGLQLGCYFSIPPSFQNSEKALKMIDAIPLCNLLLETDSPALSPLKGQRNEPNNIGLCARIIGEVKRVEQQNVVNVTSENAHKIFNFM